MAEDTSGLNYARSLDFTDSDYEEAVRKIGPPTNHNQLLSALLDVSKSKSDQSKCCSNKADTVRSSASTSCYSSITSFTSSPNQSLIDLQPQQQSCQNNDTQSLRKIFIDGLNVASRQSRSGKEFSWRQMKLCVDWFYQRRHHVKVFLPEDRCLAADREDQAIMDYLLELDVIYKTPRGHNDDIIVIEAARQNNGIIVSNDLFRDEILRHQDDVELQRFIQSNRLPFVVADDYFVPVDDPFGRFGPSLSDFLKVQPEASDMKAKLCRTRSHQRFMNKNTVGVRPIYNQIHRALQNTRSLPIAVARSDQVNNSHDMPNVDDQARSNVHPHHQRVQAKRALSTTLENSREDDGTGQNGASLARKMALCRTKSHNL